MSYRPDRDDSAVENTLMTELPTELPAPADTPAAADGDNTPPSPRKPGPKTAFSELHAGQVIGRCKIIRELGRGGMGAVYLARHQTLDVPVAVKVLPPQVAERDPQFAERFMREAKLACRIKHANVISVMDALQDETTGLYMIIQEYIDGGTVRELIKRGGVTEKQALDIVAGVAEALVTAAEFGVVHRDIKPDNVMLTAKGVVKLADLGIAKASAEEEAGLTMSHVMMGTPAYMAPEQATDAKNVDARADIYSLGATLYHMLCGTAPYSGDTAYAVLTKLATAPPPDPREKNPSISDAAADLVMRMMAKEPAKRPPTAARLLEEVNRLRHSETSSAPDLQQVARELITEMRALSETGVGVGTMAASSPAGEGKRDTRLMPKVLIGLAAAVLVILAAVGIFGGPKPSGQVPPGVSSPPAVDGPAVVDGPAAPQVPPPPIATGVVTAGGGLVPPTPVPPVATIDMDEVRRTIKEMLAEALDEQTLADPDVQALFENPARFVSPDSQTVDPALVVKELVEKRVKIQDVFALLGKPRVGIDIAETVVGKDGLTSRDSRLDRFRTALKNAMEDKYGLFVVDVTGERGQQKTQCDILISGDIETAYFAEAVPPELAELGGTVPVISYNTAVKVRFLNAVTNQDVDSSIMDFEPKGREDYCGKSHGDAIKNSIKGAIDTILPEWMKKVETSWVRLRVKAVE
ncbi:MAG: serine/threonine-protein kinase [Lentisphaeria bacterium]|nr:serine/threonine-protein kinase [Lentisphaeria bacterium]